MTGKKEILSTDNVLVRDIRSLIEEARSTVATTVNTALTMLYWRVGKRINAEIEPGMVKRLCTHWVHSCNRNSAGDLPSATCSI